MQAFNVKSSQVVLREDPRYNLPIFLTIAERLRESLYPKKAIRNVVYFIRSGATPTAKGEAYTNREKGIPFLRITDIKDYEIDLSKALYIKKEIHDGLLKRTQLELGDVLLSMAGTIGISTIVKPDLKEANINQAIARLKPIRSLATPYFLRLFFNTELGKALSDKESTVSNQPNINLEQIGLMQIPLPDLQTQTQIVDFYNSAQQKIKSFQKQADDKLTSIDNYILNKLGIEMPKFENKMSFAVKSGEITEREDPFYNLPRFRKLIELLKMRKDTISLKSIILDIQYGASVKNEYAEQGIPLLRGTDLQPNKIDVKEVVYLPEKYRKELGTGFVKVNELLITRSGTVGIVAVIPKALEGFAFGSFMIKFSVDKSRALPQFISFVLNSPIGLWQSDRNRTGSNQTNITIDGIKAIKIPLLNLDEQQDLINGVAQIMKDAEKLKSQSEQLKQTTNDLVERLILGEISLSEAQNLIKKSK